MIRWVLVLAFACTIGSGADLAEFNLVGFSDSGEYLAWEQYGVADGSGFAWAELVIVHVPANTVVYRARAMPTEAEMMDGTFPESPSGLRMLLREDASSELDSLGIIKGNTGMHNLHHSLCDISVEPDRVRFYGWVFASNYHGPEYLLEITTEPTGEEQHPDWFPPTLLLHAELEQVSGERVILVDDAAPAKSYEHTFGYRISDVYTMLGRYVAVVLNTEVPGFEGSDGRFRLIGGVLPGSMRRFQ